MTVIRPILASVGLHAFAALVFALVPFGVKAMLDHRQVITAELVELTSPVIEKLAPSQPTIQAPQTPTESPPMAQNAEARPAHVPPARKSLPRWTPPTGGVTKAEAADPVVESPSSPSAVSLMQATVQKVPEFIAIPLGSHFGNIRARTADRELGLAQDTGPAVSTLSMMGIPPVRRASLASSVATPRVLKDSTAESVGTAKSKVKSGDNLRPEYPRTAREAGWEGTVMLRVEVLPDGKAGVVSVHKTSGYSLLDEAAVTAVRRWYFTPAMDGNFPIAAVVHLPVKFDLRAP